jgi:hypothetical protein
MRGGFSALSFARMLAKIAHSYAMAKLGPTKFRPFLTNLILGESPSYPSHFVGSVDRPQPKSDVRHQIALDWEHRIDGRLFLVARIRLFGEYSMPVHTVVVGEPIDAPLPYSPTEDRPIALLRHSGVLSADGRIIPRSERSR